MPQVVEADGGEARPLQERLEAPVDDVLGIRRAARSGGEH